MRIFKDGITVGAHPALFLPKYRALVIADLHIGYESSLSQKGVFLPQNSYTTMRNRIEELLRATGAKRLVILGDLKHEFGKPSPQEWVEVKDLLETLGAMGVETHVVRGNHDNYVIAILSRYGVHLHEHYLIMDHIVLMHGHLGIELPESAKVIVIGHEHPAVSSLDSSGARYKFKCFLVGKYRGKRLVVLPAFSPLSAGSGINEIEREDLLSPYLRESDIDGFVPLAVEDGIGIFRFPSIGVMRRIRKGEEASGQGRNRYI
ncbi:MAG: metallophosphoesterase [Candidatus Methanosuratincola sp.]|jgi:putative SbcD/Mre11-related phosphoesterase|nr:metallophosphoesterase [Candidatus Methanosuratincola sp.]